MFRFFLFLSVFLLLSTLQPTAQSRRQQDAVDDYWKERNDAVRGYRDEKEAAVKKFWKERNDAIDRYQRALKASLGRNYSFKEDTTVVKALVEDALRDDIKPENLINAVKVLENGVKNRVNVDDALDVARLVQLENTNVSAEQTEAFSRARQIASQKNLDPGRTDEMLYNALREEKPAGKLVEIAIGYKAEPAPPQDVNTFSKTSWESVMKSKIQEFLTAGTPYVWGGNSIQGGVDCSGFTTIVLDAVGIKDIKKYRKGELQFNRYKNNDVKPQNAKYGDLIFFYDHKNKGMIGHVGIVERLDENGRVVFVHSSRRRNGIGRDTMTDPSYWSINFAGIKRVVI